MNPQLRILRVPEEMDAPAVDPEALRGALGFIRRINTALGYNAATLRALEEVLAGNAECGMMSEEWQNAAGSPSSGTPHSSLITPHSPLSVLDIATGSADLPAEILEWG